MLTLHHLNNSRSQRILWMLEELGLQYEIIKYERDAISNLAPPALKQIHPLGKSPVLTDGVITLAESGAIIEYLAQHYGQSLLPAQDSEAGRQYRFWLHFAEGSLMPPLVAKLVFDKVRANAKPFFVKMVANKIADKVMGAYFGPNIKANLQFIEQHLTDNEWFAGDSLSGADFQMSFPLEASIARGAAMQCPHVLSYVKRIHARPAYQAALVRGGEYAYA
ncbi:glutathione S-transferase [Paraglaciecola hydrolytica]|uniref:glutathione transferase n=1 Tax=Paraglaciecola hydrolytica TaxID=1799789 RepID=A0A136A223_9ALTE|nr:glutathione S-transferase [Paraglaciecola hydrolytica]KXI29282.1 glutathione S-transferase [Paraglaciecola hydrolytica]